MSNTYSPDAQKSIDLAENKLGDAIKSLKSQIKESPHADNTQIEIIPDTDAKEVDIVIDVPPKEPRRSEFVKTDDPKVIERINDLYGQVKKSDARNQMIIDHNRAMETALAEAKQEIERIKQTTQNTANEKAESQLKTQLRAAKEEGDYETVESIEEKLLDFRLEKRLSEKLPKQEIKSDPPKITPQQQEYEKRIIHNASYIENLANEKDPQGNLVRPYLYDWHPDNKKAVELFESIPKEFASAGKQADMQIVMQVLDERIKGRKSNNNTAVLGAEGNDMPARNVVRLTSQEIDTAKKMGIKPEAYARQKQLLNS